LVLHLGQSVVASVFTNGVQCADGWKWQVEEDDDAEPFFLTLARKIPLCGDKIAEKLDPEAIS